MPLSTCSAGVYENPESSIESFEERFISFQRRVESFKCRVEGFKSRVETFLSPFESFESRFETFVLSLEDFEPPLRTLLRPFEIHSRSEIRDQRIIANGESHAARPLPQAVLTRSPRCECPQEREALSKRARGRGL